LECDRAELSLLFVDDEEMLRLNRTWRGENRATDVLAFSQREGLIPPGREDLLGDVVISVESAGRQARARRTSLEEELDVLLVHGILHLIGYDHEAGASRARAMRKKEKELLEILGRRVKS
jgi:probable rRNA maturation factor